MERTMWGDQRLDERFDGLDRTIDRLDRDICELRQDMRELRTLMWQLWGTNMVAILITLVAVIVTRT
jgi:glutamine synthetase adenylyltransferase